MNHRISCLALATVLAIAACDRASVKPVPSIKPIIPTAPPPRDKMEFPEKVSTLTDRAFAEKFFGEIGLGRPDMKEVRNRLDAGDATGAFEEWKQALVERARTLSPGDYYTLRWAPFPLEDLMGDNVVFEGWQFKKSPMGRVGELDWHDPRASRKGDPPVQQKHQMWPLRRLVIAYEFASGVYDGVPPENIQENVRNEKPDIKKPSYEPQAMLDRWLAIWRDFANNNWRTAMELRESPEARERALKAAGMKPGDVQVHEWHAHGWRWLPQSFPAMSRRVHGGEALDIEWFPVVGGVLETGWLVNNFSEQLHHAIRANPERFLASVPARDLAEVAYFMALWPTEHLADQVTVYGWPPNQTWTGLKALLHSSLLMPEFGRAERWRTQGEESLSHMLATNWMKDGSDSELSYNYNTHLVSAGEPILALYKNCTTPPAFITDLDHAIRYRTLFLKSLNTPWGYGLGLAKTNIQYEAQPDTERKPACLSSIHFPYHGLSIMRDGWGPDALAAALAAPRRGNGHESDVHNALVVEAFGRRILVSNPGSGYEGEGNYFSSSFSENTVQVDGFGQNRFAVPKHGAYDQPIGYRWHASPHFDFAEGRFEYGYGRVLDPKTPAARLDSNGGGARVRDVTHRREVIYLRDVHIWIVVDRMEAPSNASHAYSQTWNFAKDYPEDSVRISDDDQIVSTADAKGPNIFLYQAGRTPVAYSKFFGKGYTGPGTDGHPSRVPVTGSEADEATAVLKKFPISARGWQNTGDGWMPSIFPAVDVHAEWQGTGPQTLVTVIAPSRETSSPIADIKRSSDGGVIRVELTMTDGTRIVFADAQEPVRIEDGGITARTLLVQHSPGTPDRGIALGAEKFPNDTLPSADFEFEIKPDGASLLTPITAPDGFHWTSMDETPVPIYHPGMQHSP